MLHELITDVGREAIEFFTRPNAFRSVLILLAAIGLAYWLSHFVARAIIRVARYTATRSDAETDEVKKLHLRRIETHLSVTIALVRVIIVGTVAFLVWQAFSPAASPATAAIGASAFFIVIAGATLGMVLRDVTAGAVMILERWFDVGDYIRVEPFVDTAGVVERITLRSTKLRNLTGEVIWVHNQHMQGVKVTPGGLRTIAIDVFVNNLEAGEELVGRVVATIPVGTMTVTQAPRVTRKDKWGEGLWLMTVIGRTPPGREWLMENYFVETLHELDPDGKTVVRKPLVRFADPAAERSFKRAVRHRKAIEQGKA